MKTLANGVVGEGMDSDEKQIFEAQHELKRLIKQMEDKDETQA